MTISSITNPLEYELTPIKCITLDRLTEARMKKLGLRPMIYEFTVVVVSQIDPPTLILSSHSIYVQVKLIYTYP